MTEPHLADPWCICGGPACGRKYGAPVLVIDSTKRGRCVWCCLDNDSVCPSIRTANDGCCCGAIPARQPSDR